MSIYDSMRGALEEHVFKPLGAVVVVKKTTPTLNDRGERVGETVASQASVLGVRFDDVSDKFKRQFGVMSARSSSLIVPHDTVVESQDTITVDGEDYSVSKVSRVPNSENTVALIIEMSESF